jgi:hypothetical protein
MVSCLADMPYGYFQLVRFIALFGFSVLAYFAYKQQREIEQNDCHLLFLPQNTYKVCNYARR